MIKTNIKNIYVATDQNPMKTEITKNIENVNVIHHDPWLPIIDLAILARSEYFIGNCVSSFTSFVKRERDVKGKPSLFWSL